jgi:hypothetical protein
MVQKGIDFDKYKLNCFFNSVWGVKRSNSSWTLDHHATNGERTVSRGGVGWKEPSSRVHFKNLNETKRLFQAQAVACEEGDIHVNFASLDPRYQKMSHQEGAA